MKQIFNLIVTIFLFNSIFFSSISCMHTAKCQSNLQEKEIIELIKNLEEDNTLNLVLDLESNSKFDLVFKNKIKEYLIKKYGEILKLFINTGIQSLAFGAKTQIEKLGYNIDSDLLFEMVPNFARKEHEVFELRPISFSLNNQRKLTCKNTDDFVKKLILEDTQENKSRILGQIESSNFIRHSHLSPNGKYAILFTSDWDNKRFIELWDLSNEKNLNRLLDHEVNFVPAKIEFSICGQYLIVKKNLIVGTNPLGLQTKENKKIFILKLNKKELKEVRTIDDLNTVSSLYVCYNNNFICKGATNYICSGWLINDLNLSQLLLIINLLKTQNLEELINSDAYKKIFASFENSHFIEYLNLFVFKKLIQDLTSTPQELTKLILDYNNDLDLL